MENQAQNKQEIDYKKYLPSASFLIMILCFLMPFFLIKCNNEEIFRVKWINLIWIWEPEINEKFKN